MAQQIIENRPGKAIALRLLSIFLFMVMASLIKNTSDQVPPGQAVFFRSFFAFPIILLWLWQQHDLRTGLVPQNLMGHVWRGLIGTSAMALSFAGLGLIPLPEATAIGYATPMFVVIFAAIFLGERVRIFRLSAVMLGLIGVMIVMAPRLSMTGDALNNAMTLGAVMILIASILRALVQIHVRRLVRTEHTAAIVFYFTLTASTLSLLTFPLGLATGWDTLQWVGLAWPVAAQLIAAGLIGGVAQILVTSSFRFGAASMLAPFDYASMIFAALIGWVIFNELPTTSIIAGSALVIAGGVLIIWRERQLGLDRAKSKAPVSPPGTPG
jgi:drug/metabolite transporter (DMT)-like permease